MTSEAKNAIIDNRDKGGALWVIGGQDISPIMKKHEAGGVRLKFATNSERTTKNKATWFVLGSNW